MKCLVIYNNRCGKLNVIKKIDMILSKLKTKYEVVDKKASFYDGETRDLAREACGKYDTIVVCGGDGTLHEVICGIGGQENRPKIGIIPSGTVNDVSKSLKIPRNLNKSLDIILKDKVMKHDIFKVNEEYGLYASALGLLTEISYDVKSKPKSRFGKFAYYFSIPKYIFGKKAFKVTLDIDGRKERHKASLMIVLNSRSIAGRKVDKKHNVNDGKVNLIIFDNVSTKVKLGGIWRIVKFFAFGMKKSSKNYKILECSEFKANFRTMQKINIDGEKIECDQADFKVIHPGIEIFVK